MLVQTAFPFGHGRLFSLQQEAQNAFGAPLRDVKVVARHEWDFSGGDSPVGAKETIEARHGRPNES